MLIPVAAVGAASVIKDPSLAKAIREELELSSDQELQAGHLKKLKSLYKMDAAGKIADLQGLEHAVNLTELMLPGQNIKSITPLGKLTKLNFLALEWNQITDLSPLSGVSSLEKLVIDKNQIKSLEPLKQLHNLTDLLASNNQVTDLAPIRNLKLRWLIMAGNQIQDLSPLKGHPTLEYLYLDNNAIQNIEVLETIPNLQEVSLAGNPLNKQASEIVRRLELNGVVVTLEDEPETKNDEIHVLLHEELVEFDQPPFVKDGITMVPFRILFEELGLKVTWNKADQSIVGEKEGKVIKLVVGQQSANVNGKTISLAAAPTVVSGHTFVPLRFIAESLGAEVVWNARYKLITISN